MLVRRERPRQLTGLLGQPTAFAAAHLLRLSARPMGLGLVYHRIGETQGDPERELVAAYGADLFDRHLRHLRACYRVVPASELLPAVFARRRGQRIPVSVTFDDDHESVLGVAAPILARRALPATFFLSGASLDGPHRFWWETLQDAFDRGMGDAVAAEAGAAGAGSIHAVAAAVQELGRAERAALEESLASRLGPDPPDSGMRSDGVRRLAEAGFEIGFHTLRHDTLPTLPDEELARALTDGREALAAVVGRDLRTVSYPHGQADERVGAAARAAGYDFGFTTSPQPVRRETNPHLVGRLYPTYGSPGAFAVQTLATLLRLTTGRHEASASPAP